MSLSSARTTVEVSKSAEHAPPKYEQGDRCPRVGLHLSGVIDAPTVFTPALTVHVAHDASYFALDDEEAALVM